MVCKDSMGSLIISFSLYNISDSVYISSRYLIGSPTLAVERSAGGVLGGSICSIWCFSCSFLFYLGVYPPLVRFPDRWYHSRIGRGSPLLLRFPPAY